MKKVNLDDIPWFEQKSPKGKYHKFRRSIARAMESPKTGPKLSGQSPFEVELVRLPTGAKNFPFHSHAAEWEFYLIVSGMGTMRVGKKCVKITAGDCLLHPPGEPHQIINTSKRRTRLLRHRQQCTDRHVALSGFRQVGRACYWEVFPPSGSQLLRWRGMMGTTCPINNDQELSSALVTALSQSRLLLL